MVSLFAESYQKAKLKKERKDKWITTSIASIWGVVDKQWLGYPA
jgi:hypothetical protein